MKNIKNLEAVRETSRQAQSGRVVIHLGDQEKRVQPEFLEDWLQQGWQRGPSERHRKSQGQARKGKDPWNKGLKGRASGSSTSFKPGHEPWNKGKKGTQTSWCKGLKGNDPRLLKRNQALKQAWSNAEERRNAQADRGRLNKGRRLEGEKLQHFLDTNHATRMKNQSFNTSAPEIRFYEFLCSQYGSEGVLKQYRDKQRYPFRCDFYIPSEDLFIELNLHWTHGGRPFDPENEVCQEQLKLWQKKAETSKFYQEAIITWTQRDPRKAAIAKEHNLNYKVLYSLDEI